MQKSCVYCNVEFAPKHFNQKLCSESCKDQRKKEQWAAWSKKNVDGRRKYHRRKHGENKDHYRARSFKDRYGITLDQAREILESQDGRCAICSLDIDLDAPGVNHKRKGHMDHCHDTGKPRGVLCRFCNWMLGNGYDIPERLEDGAQYLREWADAE